MSYVSLPRVQHIVASGFIAAVGMWVAWVSYTQQPAEAFLFPRLISTRSLSFWPCGRLSKRSLAGRKVGHGVSRRDFVWLLPGLIVALIYIFWAAKALGFYTAGTIAFFMLLSFYDPAPHGEAKTWIKRVIITAGFLAVMYGLFAMLLKVYTPREIFF